MELIKGTDVVAALNAELKTKLAASSYIPQLVIIRVGEKPDDVSYERGASKRMGTIGLRCRSYIFEESISNQAFVKEFKTINEDPDIDGILLLRPLPKHIDETAIEQIIDPSKDVDGISPYNMAKLFAGDETGFAPVRRRQLSRCLIIPIYLSQVNVSQLSGEASWLENLSPCSASNEMPL